MFRQKQKQTMNNLLLFRRPVVLFDPSNQKHREYFAEFVASGSWRNCPVQFVVEGDYGNLPWHIQRKLVAWYAEQEQQGKLKSGRRRATGKLSMGHTYSGFELVV